MLLEHVGLRILLQEQNFGPKSHRGGLISKINLFLYNVNVIYTAVPDTVTRKKKYNFKSIFSCKFSC